MKIRFTTSLAGEGVTRSIGDIADVKDAEGKKLIDAGYAVQIKPPGKLEKAVTPTEPTETATVNP